MKKIVFLILLIVSAAASYAAANKFTLVIDAGHGGNDAGAKGQFSKEKDINLAVALAFGRYVERNCPDVNVIYTRKSDVFVTLHGRAEIANRNKADLFVSIHTNALPSGKQARGLETYTLGMHRASDNLDVAKRENSVILVEKDYKERYQGFDPNSAESYIIFEFMQDNNMQRSVDLAQMVQRNVCSEAGRPDKGEKQAGFLVLRETSMPACLIELGFISTPQEERLLNDKSATDNMARGIYKAFVAYKKKYNGSSATQAANSLTKQKGKDVARAERKKTSAQPIAMPQQPLEADVEASRTKDYGEATNATRLTATPPTESEMSTTAEAEAKAQKTPQQEADKPLFKLQIFTTDRILKPNDSTLKGEKDADYFKEGGLYKYTLGASTNYNEILRLRKQQAKRFPGCFVIAFKNGEKMNINEAIREFRNAR